MILSVTKIMQMTFRDAAPVLSTPDYHRDEGFAVAGADGFR